MNVTDTLCDWTRFYITGDSTVGPDNTSLGFLLTDVTDELIAGYPCISDGAGNLTLSGTDLNAWYAWAGKTAAMRYLASPAGRRTATGLIESKIGRTTKRWGQVDIDKLTGDIGREANRARLRVSCIRAAITQNVQGQNTPSGGFALPGRRRVIGEARTIQDEAFGLGDSVAPEPLQPFGF